MSYSEDYGSSNDSKLKYRVGTMNYIPNENVQSGSKITIPVVCIFKNDKESYKDYTCFGISNGMVEQETIKLGKMTVTRYGEVREKDFERFSQIVTDTTIPTIPNMTHPCQEEVFKRWLVDVMQNLKNNTCLHQE